MAQFQPYVRLFVNRAPFSHGGEPVYARVTIVQFLPGRTDEAIAIYRDSVVPAAKQQKGCKGVYLFSLPDTFLSDSTHGML